MTLPMRKCPVCGLIRYSAYTEPWKCEACGAMVTEKHNIVERRDDDEGSIKFRRKEP